MNRELKFRLWDKENKCWHNPNILEVWDESGKMEPYEYVKTGKLDPIYMPLDNWVIQQFIGLLDKNSKEIYEGDIVSFSYRGYEPGIEKTIGEVFFKEGIFYFGKELIFATNNDDLIKESLEVIGNIFENP